MYTNARKIYHTSHFAFVCFFIVVRLLGVELHRDARITPPGIRFLRPSYRSLGFLGYPKRCHGPLPRVPMLCGYGAGNNRGHFRLRGAFDKFVGKNEVILGSDVVC